MKNKIKLAILIIVIISSLFILTGCTNSVTETEDRFIEIYNQPDIKIVYDKETKVEYLIILDYKFGGGITPLIDAEGKPLLYEGE